MSRYLFNSILSVMVVILFLGTISISRLNAEDKTSKTNKWITVKVDPKMNRNAGGIVYDAKADRALLVGGYLYGTKIRGGLAFNFNILKLEQFIDTNLKAFRNIFENSNNQSVFVPEQNKIYFVNKFGVRYHGPQRNTANLDLNTNTWEI